MPLHGFSQLLNISNIAYFVALSFTQFSNVQMLGDFFVDLALLSCEFKICSQNYVEPKAERRAKAIFFKQVYDLGRDVQQLRIAADFSHFRFPETSLAQQILMSILPKAEIQPVAFQTHQCPSN